MTTKEAKDYQKKYALINKLEVAELRHTSVQQKARQLATMMGLALALDWNTSSAKEVRVLRHRWNQLRKSLCA